MGPISGPAAVGLMWASMAATAASAAGTAYMQRNAAKAAAETAKRNREIAAEMARRAMDEGQEEEALQRIRIGLFMGKQRAAAAGAGAVIDQDSPLLLVEDAAAMGELDVRKIQNHTAATVWGYETQQGQFALEEQMATFQGRLLPAMTLVSGAAQSAGIYSAGSGGGKNVLASKAKDPGNKYGSFWHF